MPRPVQVLILAVAAAVLAFAAAATAPFHSPSWAARFQCPEGTSIRIREYHASWNAPGEAGISVACVDAHGIVQDSSKMETRGFWILVGIYFVPAFVAVLGLGWLVTFLRRRAAIR